MATVFTNQANISYNNITRPSNTVTGTIENVLSVTKTAISDEYIQNSELAYVISIVNYSNMALNRLIITDNLGEYAFGTSDLYPLTYIPGSVIWFRDGVPQSAPLNVNIIDNQLVIRGFNVSPRGNGTGITNIIYRTVANEHAPLRAAEGLPASITNTVTITGSGITPRPTATETVTAENDINLVVTKSVTPNRVTKNGILTYTLTIENYGPRASLPSDNVILRDVFDPYLNNIRVTRNSNDWPASNYSYSANGVFATNPGAVTVGAASYSRNAETGEWTVIPGVWSIQISGTV